jgi:polysaccharide biosynthesis protein PslH
MKILFYKPAFSWPRNSGHDVHTYHIMHSLSALGASISLATDKAPPAPAVDGLRLERLIDLSSIPAAHSGLDDRRSKSEERFRRYWGIDPESLSRFETAVRSDAYDAVVVSGLQVLPLLMKVAGPLRIWYAADEWVWHHVSQFSFRTLSTWPQLKEAALKGFYERAFRNRIDAAWLVSKSDAKWMKFITGVRDTPVLQNGVDAEYYSPKEMPEDKESVIFWGRLDFGPNIQALEWFTQNVWRRVRQLRPGALLTVMGFNPGPEIYDMQRLGGITVLPNVEDIRMEISKHAAVALPFISGGGIKNKLLEAAAMGKSIVATDRVVVGLQGNPPVKIARTPDEWIQALGDLWDHPETRKTLGREARNWVVREHNWASVGAKAFHWLNAKIGK